MSSPRPGAPAPPLDLAPFRGVSFDMDGVLYSLVRFKLAVLLRRPLDVRTWRTMARVRNVFRRRGYRSATLAADIVNEMARVLKRPVARVAADVSRLVERDWPALLRAVGPARGVERALAALASRGVPVVVTSDYPSADKVRALGLGDVPWVGTLDATAHGALKPAPEVFTAAAEALGLPPHRVLHVGDSLELDVAGAQTVGMASALIGTGSRAPEHLQAVEPTFRFDSMWDLALALERALTHG